MTYELDKLDNGPFAPRDGAALVADGDCMLLVGGWNPALFDPTGIPPDLYPGVDRKHCANDVWSFDLDTERWECIKPNSYSRSAENKLAYPTRPWNEMLDWEGRHVTPLVSFAGKHWLLGGDGNQGHYLNNIWSHAGGSWSRIPVRSPWPDRRVGHMAGAFDGYLWIVGGQRWCQWEGYPGVRTPAQHTPWQPADFRHRGGRLEQTMADVWRSSDGIRWTCVTQDAGWSACGYNHQLVVHPGPDGGGDALWALVGAAYEAPGYEVPGIPLRVEPTPATAADHFMWTRDGKTWQTAPGPSATLGFAGVRFAAVVAFDRRIWIIGGGHGVNRREIWHSTDDPDRWEKLPAAEQHDDWTPRHAVAAAVSSGNELFIVAGNSGNNLSEVWRIRIK